jgi:signal transduction histidine kinase
VFQAMACPRNLVVSWTQHRSNIVATFTVDTQLFRELGELLVGRDSTALTELIKNAYDADATVVSVTGQRLEDGEEGIIYVVDNGTGMTGAQFRDGYLTIAGRGKNQGDRRSRRFRRRFTGEKGIGRLATHKLAHHLDVRSVAGRSRGTRGRSEVRAWIDWDAIERYKTLDLIGDDALRIRELALERPRTAGTAITLSRLRHEWSDIELANFIVELDAFQPPALLIDPLDEDLAFEPLLFEHAPVRDAELEDPFSVELLGDFERSEDLWRQVGNTANWIVEIHSRRRKVKVAIAPTALTVQTIPEAKPIRLEFPAPGGSIQPLFSARILAREQGRGTRRTRDFAGQVAGVRIYMEGFRVPPYGERDSDWLGLDRDYARRPARLDLDIPGLPAGLTGVNREGLRGLPNAAYVGAVLLTHRGASDLEVLVNREGFVPSEQLDAIRKTVRIALDLLTRARARLGAAEGTISRGKQVVLLSDELRVRDGLREAAAHARALRTAVATVTVDLDDDAQELAEELDELTKAAERAVADRSLMRILASVGTQMAAFVHETQGLVSAAHSVSRALELLAERNPAQRETLQTVRKSVEDIARRIDTQARYLSDVTTVAARRRRQRLLVMERFEVAALLLEPVLDRLGIEIDNELPSRLRTAPMFPAELTVILSNLITNAVKAAGEQGRIRISGKRDDDDGLLLRIDNTGKSVDPASGEQWFVPFASTTVESLDPVLGQGMGLGLPITRSIAEDYRGSVRFVAPLRGFATAVEVRLP